jgi:hypothetical protein
MGALNQPEGLIYTRMYTWRNACVPLNNPYHLVSALDTVHIRLLSATYLPLILLLIGFLFLI